MGDGTGRSHRTESRLPCGTGLRKLLLRDSLVPGAEVAHSVELAEVMFYSSLLNQSLDLPMDSPAHDMKSNELIAGSKLQIEVIEVLWEDFMKSFTQ